MQKTWVWSLGQEDPFEEGMTTHSQSCLKNPQGQRSLVGYGPWCCTESDTTEATEHKACKNKPMFLVHSAWQSGGRPAVPTVTPPPKPLLTNLPSCYLMSGHSFTTCTWTTINRVFITTMDFGTAWVSSQTVSFGEQDSFHLSLLHFLVTSFRQNLWL